MNKELGVGLSSTGRSTRSTTRRKPSKVGMFSGTQVYCCHPFTVADRTCL